MAAPRKVLSIALDMYRSQHLRYQLIWRFFVGYHGILVAVLLIINSNVRFRYHQLVNIQLFVKIQTKRMDMGNIQFLYHYLIQAVRGNAQFLF